MKTRKLIRIWLLTFAVALFFHSPLLAHTGLENVPFCLGERAGLLEAGVREVVEHCHMHFNELPFAATDPTGNPGALRGYLSDVLPAASLSQRSILRI